MRQISNKNEIIKERKKDANVARETLAAAHTSDGLNPQEFKNPYQTSKQASQKAMEIQMKSNCEKKVSKKKPKRREKNKQTNEDMA